MAQSWRRGRAGPDDKPPPLDAGKLERLALRYVERYATTRAKLRTYLSRKVRERGWQEEDLPDLDALTTRFAALGYVDDQAFAVMKSDALSRRGFGQRRIAQALHQAGIDEDLVPERSDDEAWAAALRFAKRRRIGPFASEKASGTMREKALASMLRAGHPMRLARAMVDAVPGHVPDWDDG